MKIVMKYDQKVLDKIADSLEAYLDIVTSYVIIEGITKDEYDGSVKTIKKLIKKLRKGKGDEVFDKERYLEALRENRLIC